MSDHTLINITTSVEKGKGKAVVTVDNVVASQETDLIAEPNDLSTIPGSAGSAEMSDQKAVSVKSSSDNGNGDYVESGGDFAGSPESSDQGLSTIKYFSTNGNGITAGNIYSDVGSGYSVVYYDSDPHGVGDRLYNAYPDRMLDENHFPGLNGSQNTPALQIYYNELRAGIMKAIHDDNFRCSHFKDIFTPDRSILSMILDLQMSGEVSKEQFNVFFRFGRGWSRAIGESASWAVLDERFISYVGLEYAYGDLMYMFEQEKREPLPYPLPDNLKYIDPKTMREKYGIACEYEESKVGALAGYVSAKRIAARVSGSVTHINEGGPVFSKAGLSTLPAGEKPATFEELGITKEVILATLAEYSAATSPDRVLRNAWKEISKMKGELDEETIHKLSDETRDLMHRHIQFCCAQKNIPMPMGFALNATIARLEKLDIKGSDAFYNPRSDVYDSPAPDSTSHKSKSGVKTIISKLKQKAQQG